MIHRVNNIRWQVLETRERFFREHHLETPNRLIRECQVVKEDHKSVVYFHQAGRFYIKRLHPRIAKREWRNWTKLFEQGLSTITPIAIGISRDHAYLVSLAHDDWVGLYEVFDSAKYWERLRLLQRLGEAIQALHTAGFYHGDLHGGNFLARLDRGQPDIRMVDFQRGRFCKLSRRRRLTNLADLALSHFFHVGIREWMAFLAGYFGSSQAARAFIRQEGRRLERLILKRSSQVADRKVRKSRKVNKYFDRLTVQGSRYQGVYLRKNRDLIPESFLSFPLNFVCGEEVEVIKDFRSVRVVRYQDVCIKCYERRGLKDVLKSWLGLSKGKKSFQWALAMVNRFVATPEPICYLEGRGGDSFYLSRFVHSSHNLVAFLEEVPINKRGVCLQALASFLGRMFYRGVYHLDLKGTNILVRPVGSKFEFYLSDTDEMAIFWKGSPALLKKSLLRITRTLLAYFSRQELVKFVTTCLSGLKTLPRASAPEHLVDQAIKIQRTQRL